MRLVAASPCVISAAIITSILFLSHAEPTLTNNRARIDAPRSRVPFPHVSTWRRLHEDSLKPCDSVDFTWSDIKIEGDGDAIAAGDFDGDGDLDVLMSSTWDDEIAWLENLDGVGNFSVPHFFNTSQYARPDSVQAVDIDGDGDLDVLSIGESSRYPVCWYENLDGAGDFSGGARLIWRGSLHETDSYGLVLEWYSPSSAAAADLDGDGDLDVLSASLLGESIAWYENLDGAGNFSGPQHVITNHETGVKTVVAADLDGDADLDVLSASMGSSSRIVWYVNLGAGDFKGWRLIATQAGSIGAVAAYSMAVAAADLDGDSDLDVLSASYNDNKIVWFENVDGHGDFSGPQRVITTQVDGPYSVVAADLDGDGDLDVLAASVPGDLSWYENLDGAGKFTQSPRILPTWAHSSISFAAADMDADGAIDLLSAYYKHFGWYKNECEAAPPAPTPMPTYWGPQVFGKQPQTAAFERFCVAWCVIFSVISVVVLGYVVHASPHTDMKLARIILTIMLSQFDYGSDTLFIGFQNFVTPTLFVAALIAYLLPLAAFIVVYRRIIGVHLSRIYTATKARTIVRFDSWDSFPKALTEIGSFALFPFAFTMSIFVYLMLLVAFISCKLTLVSFFTVKFFETGGFECTQETFEIMFKRNIFSELVFESSGELIIVLVDTILRARQDFRSNTGLSSWATLSIVGSSLMLVIEVWPYLYRILWMGLNTGIAAVSTNLKFTPDKVLAPWLINRFVSFAELSVPDGTTPTHKEPGCSDVPSGLLEMRVP